MYYIVILIIKIYYKIYPEDQRRVCIYAESCSKYVLRVAKNKGFFEAIKAYSDRIKSCNVDYIHTFPDGVFINITTKNGVILEENEINPFLVKSLKSIYSS